MFNFEKLINKAKNRFFPVTHAQGVLVGDGKKTLQDLLDFMTTSEYVADISDETSEDYKLLGDLEKRVEELEEYRHISVQMSYGLGSLDVLKKGAIKRINFDGYYRQNNIKFDAETSYTLCTLPEDCRPIKPIFKIILIRFSFSSATEAVANLQIKTSGEVILHPVTDVPIKSYLLIDETFI